MGSYATGFVPDYAPDGRAYVFVGANSWCCDTKLNILWRRPPGGWAQSHSKINSRLRCSSVSRQSRRAALTLALFQRNRGRARDTIDGRQLCERLIKIVRVSATFIAANVDENNPEMSSHN